MSVATLHFSPCGHFLELFNTRNMPGDDFLLPMLDTNRPNGDSPQHLRNSIISQQMTLNYLKAHFFVSEWLLLSDNYTGKRKRAENKNFRCDVSDSEKSGTLHMLSNFSSVKILFHIFILGKVPYRREYFLSERKIVSVYTIVTQPLFPTNHPSLNYATTLRE